MTKARDLADRSAADITAVTAGTGISISSGAGPIPTVTNTVATGFDAKGDLIVGTGADTFTTLTVASTANYVLTVDSSTTSGIKWAAAAAGGKVLQVVYSSYSTATTIASTTFADTGLSATITPSSTTSKVLIMTSQAARISRSSGNGIFSFQRILRGATEIFVGSSNDGTEGGVLAALGGGSELVLRLRTPLLYLDSPSTTSATTYKTQGRVQDTANTGQAIYQDGSSTSTIVLMEIGA